MSSLYFVLRFLHRVFPCPLGKRSRPPKSISLTDIRILPDKEAQLNFLLMEFFKQPTPQLSVEFETWLNEQKHEPENHWIMYIVLESEFKDCTNAAIYERSLVTYLLNNGFEQPPSGILVMTYIDCEAMLPFLLNLRPIVNLAVFNELMHLKKPANKAKWRNGLDKSKSARGIRKFMKQQQDCTLWQEGQVQILIHEMESPCRLALISFREWKRCYALENQRVEYLGTLDGYRDLLPIIVSYLTNTPPFYGA